MKLIPLTQGLHAMVDDEDHEELSRFKWCAGREARSGRTWYAKRMARVEGPRVAGKTSPRVQLGMHTHLTGFSMTDHIDGNGLNNQRSNLRPADRSQNMRNRLTFGGSSRFKGVHFNKAGRIWKAAIRNGSEAIYLGRFHWEEDAAGAYDIAARALHGPYAALNFPLPGERSAITGEVAARA